jgi:hypothetical protein
MSAYELKELRDKGVHELWIQSKGFESRKWWNKQ